MTNQEKVPTLTDPQGLGGIVAQEGFDYQVWSALARLPAWLRNPGFEGFTIEGLEDFEARFFSPHSPHGHVLDRYQAKSGQLSRTGVKEVFESLKTFSAKNPNTVRVQALVTPTPPSTLAWIARDPDRVRRARPFYRPFPTIIGACDDKLRQDFVDEFGADLGSFAANSIETILQPLPNRTVAEAMFAGALDDAFPGLNIVSSKAKAAFSDLVDLAGKSRGAMLTKSRLLDVIDAALGTTILSERRPINVHIRSDRNGASDNAIEIDASMFSGADHTFPTPDRWNADLIMPLEKTARWARCNNHHRISLSGSYRLSSAIAIGWSFRSANGFDIEIETRTGSWTTDEHVPHGSSSPSWNVANPVNLINGRLVVAVGVIRNPVEDVQRSLGVPNDEDILVASHTHALAGGTEAQNYVGAIKAAVSNAAAKLNPEGIDLFFAGPAALAVALGHRWNALPSTQFYEFVAGESRYVPTVALG